MEKYESLLAESRLLQLFTAIEDVDLVKVRFLISLLGVYVNNPTPDNHYDDDDDDEYDNNDRTPLHDAVLTENIEILKLFAEAENVNFNVKDCFGRTPLHLAVKAGYTQVMKLLLDTGKVDVNAKNFEYETALHMAAKSGYTEILKLLANAQNIDVNLQDGAGYTAVQYALEKKNFDQIKILIDAGANVNTSRYGKTAILLALESNNTSFAKYLLSRGADVKYLNFYHRSLLHIAAEKSEGDSHLAMIEVFLNNGVDVNAQDKRGNTTLHILLERRNNNKTVKLLMDFKADINLTDNSGEAPLINAIRSGNEEAVKLLSDHGCDVKSFDSYRSTLLHHIAKENQGDSLFKTIEVLLKQGADCNAQDVNGNTPFHNLVKRAHIKTVLLFLDFGADVHVQNNDGDIPLFNAVENGNINVPQLLINLGVVLNAVRDGNFGVPQLLANLGSDVNIINKNGETPLFNAAKSENLEVVQMLVNLGTNVNIKNSRGKNPLFNAVDNKNVEIVKLLLKHGSDVNLVDYLGENPLSNAVKIKNVEIVQLLVDHGSNVNKININQGWTPLHLAAWNHEVPYEIFKILLKAGADANALDLGGESPLLILLSGLLAIISSVKKVKFMLKYSDVNIISLKGDHFLSYYADESVKKICLEHIAKLNVLDVSINPSILNMISSDDGHSVYSVKCLEELNLAKNTRIKDCWVTLFNILFDNKRKLKNFAGNATLIREFEKIDCLQKFPIYGSTMQKNFEKGKKKRKLFDKSAGMLSNNWPIFGPNHLIIRDLLDCLTTKDLSKFCE